MWTLPKNSNGAERRIAKYEYDCYYYQESAEMWEGQEKNALIQFRPMAMLRDRKREKKNKTLLHHVAKEGVGDVKQGLIRGCQVRVGRGIKMPEVN